MLNSPSHRPPPYLHHSRTSLPPAPTTSSHSTLDFCDCLLYPSLFEAVSAYLSIDIVTRAPSSLSQGCCCHLPGDATGTTFRHQSSRSHLSFSAAIASRRTAQQRRPSIHPHLLFRPSTCPLHRHSTARSPSNIAHLGLPPFEFTWLLETLIHNERCRRRRRDRSCDCHGQGCRRRCKQRIDIDTRALCYPATTYRSGPARNKTASR